MERKKSYPEKHLILKHISIPLSYLLVLMFLVLPTTPTGAEELNQKSKLVWPPITETVAPENNSIIAYRWGIVDDFVFDHSIINTNPYTQGFCESFQDEECKKYVQNNGEFWGARAVYPPCSNINQKNCIESVELENGSGELKALVLEKVLEFPKIFGDASLPDVDFSAASLWHLPGDPVGDGYFVSVSSDIGFADGRNADSRKYMMPFSAAIKPYSTFNSSSITGPSLFRDDRGIRRVSGGYPPGCIWGDAGKCGFLRTFPASSRMHLTIRVQNDTGSWFFGRIRSPQIDVERLISGQYRVHISGYPVDVPLFQIEIPFIKAKQELDAKTIDQLCNPTDSPFCQKGYVGGNSASWSTYSSEMFTNLERFSSQKANIMLPSWSVRSNLIGDPFPNCQSASLVKGIVTTNASLYQSTPPDYINSELTYKVAGLHLTDTGEVFKGSYDLVIDSSVAQCFYNISKSDFKATISVTDSQGIEQLVTTSFQESKNWIYFSANGFTFSRPSISIRLEELPNKSSEEIKAVPKISPSPSPSPVATIAVLKKLTITCRKGKTTKKVTAYKPMCPKGFKKI